MVPKAEKVRSMFAGIAPRYDLLNHLLSFNLDRLWRRAAVRSLEVASGQLILDACAGTLDLSELIARRGARVVALDFCREMLVAGRGKAPNVALVEGDAMSPPFAAANFDAVTAAFGVRNLADPTAGLRTLAQLVKPGGRIAILEFAQPRNKLFRAVYYFYFRNVLPRIGRLLSGHDSAYHYLPESVIAFLEPEEMAATLAAAGMIGATHHRLGFGAVTLVTARMPA